MILGILGGMGPLATSDFLRKLIELTQAKSDQDHIHTIIDSNPQIPDRTAYILGKGQSPLEEMKKSLKRLEKIGVDLVAMPCNTAHYYYEDLTKDAGIKVIHMIEEVAKYAKENYSSKDFLLLSTLGTYKSQIYQKSFEKYGLSIIEPNDKDKEYFYNQAYMVKRGDFNFDKHQIQGLIDKYIRGRDAAIVLGCTELPIMAEKADLSGNFIDSTYVLAKTCVKICKGI